MFQSLQPKTGKGIPFLIFVSFFITFITSRAITYLFPSLHVSIRGVHVHHFAYGILILSIVGYLSLFRQLTYRDRLRLSLLYGIGLGLAFDEFAMWLELENIYHDRKSYDAVLSICLIMLNIIYFDTFWKRWGTRLGKLFKILFLTGPKRIIGLVLQAAMSR